MQKHILIQVALLLCSMSIYAQNSKKAEKQQKREKQYQEVVELIDSQQYEFIGQKANTTKGRMIDLTTNPNFLRVTDNTSQADMPYFGRAYSGGYSSSDGGIQFNGPMDGYDVQKNDQKRKVIVKFKVKEVDDTFDCTLTISSRENASLSVTSNKKQGISYLGSIKEVAEEKK